MVYQKNQKGVSLITLVITIVVIIILALITLGANNNSIEEATAVKFKQELAEVKRGVETVKLINSKDGLDEATLNKNFKKVEVKEAPDNFVSFDEDRSTAYLVDLEEIDYKKVKTGQKYKEIDEGGTVTFGVDDVYVYDREGTVYYVKGTYLEGKENIYTTEEKRTEGPIVSAQNTERGIIQIKVTPTNGGVITSVTVDGIEATKISDGLYEIEVSKNGTYTVIATEEGNGTSAINVTVRKIVKEDADPIPTPAAGTIIINNGEMYATDEKAIVKINSDAELMYLKHVTTGSAPIVPTSESLGWTRVLSEKTIYLSEGKNDIWVWFRNEGNNTFPYDKKSIILDTTPPTDTRPTVEENADGSLTVKSNQIDMGSGLKKVDIGYKLLSDTEYKKIEVSDLTNLTEKITGIIEGEVYSVITIAEDNVGLVSTSKETIVGSIKEIPNDIKITYSPTKGWTKRSEAIITYPVQSNNSLYQRWYRVNNEPWQSVNSMEETLNFDEKVEIEAVVVKVVNSTTVLGEIKKVVINNIDNTKPIIGEITFESADGISEADYKAKTILEDSESGIRYYAITNSEADPTSWSELDTAVKSKEITFDANIGNTYYVWAKDDVGNVNYKGVKPEGKDFTAPNITVELDRTEFEYTGLEIRPEVIVKDSGDLLKNETHYRLVYEENVNAGTGKIYVIGIVPYVGTREITFTITKATPIIEIKDISYKYDATIKEIEEAVVLGTENGDVPSGEITYIYYKDISLTTKTSISDGATIDGGAPKNVGTYYVVANIAEAGNYKAATSNTAILGIQERDVKVLFDANGGTIAESERTVYYGKIYGTMPEATKDGYKLEGWYTENNEKVEADTIVNNLYEHTLYAKWYGAQAIYTEGNQTLTFVKREAIAVGDTFSGETVTEVYTGFEEDAYIYASYVPWNDYALNIEKVVVKDTISPVSTAWWFWSMRNAVSIDVAKLNTTNVRDMSWMFHEAGYNTTTFEIIGLNNWNTSNVNTMSRMFNFAGYKVDEFEISGLNNWDTTNVTDMSYMFSHTGYNSQTWKIEDLSNWNTLNVTNMEFMFDYSGYMAKNYELVGINKWDTRSVRNMSYMFNCAGQFANTWTIGKLDNWNTSNVTNFKYMFCLAGDSATTWDIGNLSKKTITKEDGTTYTAWNTYNATDMSYMFQSAGSNATTWTIGDIGNWNVSKVTNMTRMLSGIGYNVNTFTMDLGSWDTSSVTSMSEMFYSTGHNAKTFELKGLNNWDTSNVTSMSSMFWNLGYSSNGFSLDLSGWNTSNITDMSYMFHNGERLINLNISGWNTSNVTSSSGMFNNCNRLEEITVGTGFTLASLLPTPSSTYITGADGNWYNKATGAEYTPATIPSGEAATYVAVAPKITITFNANGGQLTDYGESEKGFEVMPGSSYAELGNGLGLPEASYDGYEFLGWFTATTGGTQVTAETIAIEAATVYAQWIGAQAIYTEGNQTLTFVKRAPIAVGDTFSGETVTAVYTGFETDIYTSSTSVPWYAKGTKITSVAVIDTITPASTTRWFVGFKNTAKINVTKLDISNVTDMSFMFYEAGYNATTFEIVGLNNFDTSNVTDMGFMFECAGLGASTWSIGDLSNWNTSSVTNMSRMFRMAGYNASTWNIGNLDSWNTGLVTDMKSMFYCAGQNATTWNIGNLSAWNTDLVKNMNEMFECAGYKAITWDIGNLSNWKTSAVTDMGYMFYQAGYSATTWDIGNLDNWKTSAVTNMNCMFYQAGYNATTWNLGDLSSWDTALVPNMSYMFYQAGYKATIWNIGDLSSWNTALVTNMSYMFYQAGYSATTWNIGHLSSWNTALVTNMSYMFYQAGYNATTFNLNLSNWKTDAVTTMGNMFYSAGYSAATWSIGDLSSWNTALVTNMSAMFVNIGQNATTLGLNLSSWNTALIKDMSGMFTGAGYNATTVNLNLSNWKTGAVTNMQSMFSNVGYNATTIKLDLNGWDTSNVTYVSSMFYCLGYNAEPFSLNLSSWDTSKVLNFASSLFAECRKLKEITVGEKFTLAGKLPTPNSVYIPGADGKWYNKETGEGYTVIPSGIAATYTAIAPPKAYAVYSATDNSLRFYKTDSTITQGSTYNELVATAVYTGIEEMTLSSGIPWRNYASQIKTVSVEDIVSPISTSSWFYDFKNVTQIDVSKLNTSKVTDMSLMFSSAGYNAKTFEIIGLNNWDTSSVTGMGSMFYQAGYAATTWNIGDISNWDTSSVTDMSSMFCYTGIKISTFKLDLSKWNTSKVKNMLQMFSGAGYNASTFEVNLSGWSTLNVTDLSAMFRYAGYNTSTFKVTGLNTWNVSNVTNMGAMFYQAGYAATTWNIGDLSSWDTGAVTSISSMFYQAGYNATTFTLNLSSWDIGLVTSISSMFEEAGFKATTFTLNLSNWNTSEVTNMSYVFSYVGRNATTFSLDLSGWDTSNVINMGSMFYYAGYSATWSLNCSNWNVNLVTEYSYFNTGVESKVIAPTWVN